MAKNGVQRIFQVIPLKIGKVNAIVKVESAIGDIAKEVNIFSGVATYTSHKIRCL